MQTSLPELESYDISDDQEKKDTIRTKTESLNSSIEDKLTLDPTSFPDVLPTLACLAHHGFLSRIREWQLNLDMDLGLLPTHYLPSLES